MRVSKIYRAKTITGAERKVRELQRLLDEHKKLIDRFAEERILLAKLAATGPAFFNPLEAAAAETIRDRLLAKENMRPDGSFMSKGPNT